MSSDKPKSKLWISEDYWAIWIGSISLMAGIVFFLFIAKNEIVDDLSVANSKLEELSQNQAKTISWYLADEQLTKLTGANTPIGQSIKGLFSRPKTWESNPVEAFYSPAKVHTESVKDQLDSLSAQVQKLKKKALEMEKLAIDASFKDTSLNEKAAGVAAEWYEQKTELSKLESNAGGKGYNILPGLALLALVFAILFGFGAHFMGYGYARFMLGFLGVFLLAVLAYLLASQSDMKNMGFGYAIWAIVIGLIISNTVGTPSWMKPAVQTEYYIKTGLVLLGAEILLSKIVAIGLPGIFVAWVVTPVVLITTFWFGQRILKIGSKTLNITISADMSVCGVSAAIATAAACNAKKEELTLAVGLSMVFTSIMMIALPAFINAVGIPEVLGGAWVGGTIDATGAVVAAGAFLGDKALNVAATIKMIQNVLIGIIAFGVAVYWASRVENKGKTKVGISEIWKRFPKFILGFLGASVIFSIIYASSPDWFSNAFVDHGVIDGLSKNMRGWLFCLAFISIGLSVNFKELKHQFSGGKPLILYVCGQTLNLMLTLLMAYLMFYLVFPEITELI
jgi:uncharacterized integral membrane protein (TIGR00698 family)